MRGPRANPAHRPGRSWLTVDEVAAELRVSKMTVLRLIKARALPAYRIGRSLRVDERDLDAYLDATRWDGR